MGYKLPSSRIKLLDLAYNKITDKGLLFLLDTIKKVYKLDILYIWGNKFSNQVCRRIIRMLISGVLTQNNLDVQIYKVDGINHAALYSVDRYKHIYYCVGDYGFPQPIRISKPHEDLIPTQVFLQPVTRKRKGIQSVCPQAIKLIDECDVEKKSTDQNEFLSIVYEVEKSLDCRISSLYTIGSTKTLPHQEDQRQEDTFKESIEYEEHKPNLFFLKRKKVRNLIMDMKERKLQQMKKYCYEDMKSIIYQIVEGLEKVQKSKKQETKCPSTLLHEDIDTDSREIVETEVAEVQTSFPLLRSQYFSFELRSSYPLTSYSIADMELAKKNEIDILADVQDAYVRKYEQPNILQEERYDLCNDPYYRINDSPFIITHVADEKIVEAEGEGEIQEVLVAEAESTISEKEEKLRPMFSSYEILERNIYGVPLMRPLSKDAKEELFKKHRESSTSSESMETSNTDQEEQRSVFTMLDEGTQTEAPALG